eukprot:TRINITY_DN7021_c0_g1_i1.p1 TRINITY_DN7021_c0_g1~~TRINITY_DN7021_c0_g1_i1.p1  ORF type:complete len:123 (+),score=23.87 TRINITY_DN7021_c0_g1_i1:82-450(+)
MLRTAKEGLGVIIKETCDELAAMEEPPPCILQVFAAVAIILGENRGGEFRWSTAQRLLRSHKSFLASLHDFDTARVTPELVAQLEPFMSSADFNAKDAGAHSIVAGRVCAWVLAVATMGLRS